MPSIRFKLASPFSKEEAQQKLCAALPSSRYFSHTYEDFHILLINKSEVEGRFAGLNLLPQASIIISEGFSGSRLDIRVHTRYGFFRNYAFYLITSMGLLSFLVIDAVKRAQNIQEALIKGATLLLCIAAITAVLPAVEFFSETAKFKKIFPVSVKRGKIARSFVEIKPRISSFPPLREGLSPRRA